jgi:hypothetical protein
MTANKAKSRLAAVRKLDCLKAIVRIGNDIEETIEARDTIRKARNTETQIKNNKPRIGFSPEMVKVNPIRTPMVVATPFPPLNFRNIVQLWPHIQQNPMIKRNCSSVKKVFVIRIFPRKTTGMAPFKMSRIKIVIPKPLPRTLRALVAPTFPEPTVRISTPFNRWQNM